MKACKGESGLWLFSEIKPSKVSGSVFLWGYATHTLLNNVKAQSPQSQSFVPKVFQTHWKCLQTLRLVLSPSLGPSTPRTWSVIRLLQVLLTTGGERARVGKSDGRERRRRLFLRDSWTEPLCIRCPHTHPNTNIVWQLPWTRPGNSWLDSLHLEPVPRGPQLHTPHRIYVSLFPV